MLIINFFTIFLQTKFDKQSLIGELFGKAQNIIDASAVFDGACYRKIVIRFQKHLGSGQQFSREGRDFQQF